MKASILFLLLLTGCVSAQPVLMYPTLPASITSPCVETHPVLKTNEDLLYWNIDLKSELAQCSVKQKALADAITPKSPNK